MRHAFGHNYRNSSFIVDVAKGQIPRSTERISNFYQVWPSTTYICLYYRVFWYWCVMSRCNFDLYRLTLKVCGTSNVTWAQSVRNLSEIEQSPAELCIILRMFVHAISHCDLHLWPFDFELLGHFVCHAIKLCTQFERNRILRGWDIDDLPRFRVRF